jgi:predicted dehydrogenase
MSRDVSKRRLRAGIVGGGQGSFIGAVHRVAAELDGQAEVIAGAMSTNPERAQASADAWYLKRSYNSYEEMAALPRRTHLSGAWHPRRLR